MTAASGGDPGAPDVIEHITNCLKTLRVLVGDPDAERILGRDRYIDQRKRVEAEIRTDTS